MSVAPEASFKDEKTVELFFCFFCDAVFEAVVVFAFAVALALLVVRVAAVHALVYLASAVVGALG